MNKNEYYEKELQECINKYVVVEDIRGKTYEGQLVAYSSPHLNIVLRTFEDKLIIKNIANFRRKRKSVLAKTNTTPS